MWDYHVQTSRCSCLTMDPGCVVYHTDSLYHPEGWVTCCITTHYIYTDGSRTITHESFSEEGVMCILEVLASQMNRRNQQYLIFIYSINIILNMFLLTGIRLLDTLQ